MKKKRVIKMIKVAGVRNMDAIEKSVECEGIYGVCDCERNVVFGLFVRTSV